MVPAAIGFLLAGLSDGPLTVLLHTMQQTETPAELRGRVFSAIGALFMTAAPLGVLAAGPVLEAGGAIPWMFAHGGDVHGRGRPRLAVADHPPRVSPARLRPPRRRWPSPC